MKTLATFYILNTKNEKSFDTNEGRFYPSNWEPVLEEESYLKMLFEKNPDTFENCIIVDVNN